MADVLKWTNLTVVFLVELVMLVNFAIWGFSLHVQPVVKALAGIGLPVAVIIVWSMFFAPKASMPLGEPWNTLGELTLFISSAAALYAAGHHQTAIIFGVVAVCSELLALVLK